MKTLITIFLSVFAMQISAQTLSDLPPGTTSYSTQIYRRIVAGDTTYFTGATGKGFVRLIKATDTKISGADTVNFTINGINCRLITPSTYTYDGVPNKLAIFFHARAGNYTQTMEAPFMDSLLAKGYSIATTTAESLWGNEEHQQRYIRLYNYLQEKFNFQREPVIFSLSMGSIAAMNVIHRAAMPAKAWISIAGVTSIKDYYTTTSSPIKADIEDAYNFSGSGAIDSATFGYDPYTRLKSVFGDTTYRAPVPTFFLHGSLDFSANVAFTRSIYKAMAATKANVYMKEIPGMAHDVAIENAANIHSILEWLNQTSTFNRTIPLKVALRTDSIAGIGGAPVSNVGLYVHNNDLSGGGGNQFGIISDATFNADTIANGIYSRVRVADSVHVLEINSIQIGNPAFGSGASAGLIRGLNIVDHIGGEAIRTGLGEVVLGDTTTVNAPIVANKIIKSGGTGFNILLDDGTTLPISSLSSGTVTGVTSANADISVSPSSPNPVLTLNSGTGANQIVKRDGSGNLNATTATSLVTGRTIAITGDITYTSPAFDGSGNVTAAGTLASVISAGGPTGSSTVSPVISYDAKGRLTAVSSATITPAIGSVTGLGSGIATALGVNTGTSGAPVINGGALGTPSSGVATNLTGTANGLTSGAANTLTTNRTILGQSFNGSANVSGDISDILKITARSGAISGGYILGGNVNSTGNTDATRKYQAMGIPHYLNAEAPITTIVADANTSVTELKHGGGQGTMNAVTVQRFYAAANNTTLSGTEMATLDINGFALLGTPTAPTATAGTNNTQIATTAFVQSNSSGRQLEEFYTDVSTSGTTETDFYSYTIPGGTMINNGDKIQTVWVSTYTGTTPERGYYINGTKYLTEASVNTTQQMSILIIRTGSTTGRAIFTTSSGPSIIDLTGVTWSGTVALKFTGKVATGTMTAKVGTIEYKPVAP